MNVENESKSILVTGASGYVGSRLVEHLREKGKHRIHLIEGRRDFSSKLQKVLNQEKIDCIIHAGFEVDFNSRTEQSGESENVLSTRLIAQAAHDHQVSHIVFLSAAAVLGVSNSGSVRNESSIGTTDPEYARFMETQYVADKLACEAILRDVPGVTVTTLYMTTVYGKKMSCETYRSLMGVKSPSPVMVIPPGGTSFLALDDFLAAIELVIDKKTSGSFVLSSGNVTYEALYESVAKTLGVSYRKIGVMIRPRMKRPLLKVVSMLKKKVLTPAVIESTFGYKYYSSQKLAAILGWRPRASLDQTLWSMLKQENKKELT